MDEKLQEKLHKNIRSAWSGIVYDKDLAISQEQTGRETCELCTIYKAGSQHLAVFDADSFPERFAEDVQNAVRFICQKIPACASYNFSVQEIEGGTRWKIHLTLESSPANP